MAQAYEKAGFYYAAADSLSSGQLWPVMISEAYSATVGFIQN
jgi:hypothetical protein